MKTNFRRDVMKMAHEINKASRLGKSLSLQQAWKLHFFEESLSKGVVRFAFRKKDGTVRLAKGTLKNTDALINGAKRKSYKAICYYDLSAGGYRSFNVQNLIAVY